MKVIFTNKIYILKCFQSKQPFYFILGSNFNEVKSRLILEKISSKIKVMYNMTLNLVSQGTIKKLYEFIPSYFCLKFG